MCVVYVTPTPDGALARGAVGRILRGPAPVAFHPLGPAAAPSRR